MYELVRSPAFICTTWEDSTLLLPCQDAFGHRARVTFFAHDTSQKYKLVKTPSLTATSGQMKWTLSQIRTQRQSLSKSLCSDNKIFDFERTKTAIIWRTATAATASIAFGVTLRHLQWRAICLVEQGIKQHNGSHRSRVGGPCSMYTKCPTTCPSKLPELDSNQQPSG